MSRAALAACLLLVACTEPQVFLAEKPFAWQSALAIPFEYETGLGMHRATMLMVTDRPDACRSARSAMGVRCAVRSRRNGVRGCC